MALRPGSRRLVTDRGEALTRTLDLLGELLGPDRRSLIDDALGTARVLLVVDGQDLVQARTQAAVYVLASLLVRSGVSLQAQFAAVPRAVDLPGLVGEEFGPSMARAVARMSPGARLSEPQGKPDIVVAIGNALAPAGRTVLRISALDRRAWVTRRRTAAGAWVPGSALVALAAAGLAAGEVLKDVLRPVSSAPIDVLEASEPSFEVGVDLPERVHLGRLFAISGGAINQQFLLALQAEESISADLVLFDRDTTVLSNVNRCPYVMIDELGQPKVTAIASYVPARLTLIPVARHLDNTSKSIVPAGSTIVVGADDIAVRHLAQRLRPSCLTIGATSHFLALVTEHPDHHACAGCAHRDLGEAVAVIPTWSIVSFWGGFLVALRVIGRALGSPYPASRQVTNFWPLCPDAVFEHALAFNTACPIEDHLRIRDALAM